MAKDLQRYRDAERRVWERLAVTPSDRLVTLASGGRVRVQEVGDGTPFLLIHGGSVAGTSWARLVAELHSVRCIVVDRPGCGLSDPIVGGSLRTLGDVEAYADRFLGDLLDALGLDSAAVGATSYGGYYAFRGAAAVPERVTRLVEYSWLIGAPSDGAPLTARLGAVPGVRTLMARVPMSRGMVERALRQFGLSRAIDSGAFDAEALDWCHALLRDTDTLANELRSTPDVITPLRGQNAEILLTDELLTRLTMPTLLVWGEDDPNGGAAVARAFAARLPNAELVIVPGAQHAPWYDDLETCVLHTIAFLEA